MTALLRAEGLGLFRGGRILFEGLAFALGPGDGLLLTGPNGSGKTSLLRLIAGLLRPGEGRIDRADAALADDKLALDRELPLRRALGFWRGPNLDKAIGAFALEPLLDVPVRLLSTGQAKRAQLAAAMATGAPLLLLDEPLNGLDGRGAEELHAAIDAHRSAGGAVAVASHLPMPGSWTRLELGR